MDLPPAVNLGSGKDWRRDHLNIDFNPIWEPDLVLDLNRPFPFNTPVHAARFGSIFLRENQFDSILANDILEHVTNLTSLMTDCLRLLKPGGEFRITVPYDLSYGAWQDPTHVRGFNERSWLYYTEWFWYLGWQDARFDLAVNHVELSPLGEELQRGGSSLDFILRQPRAVDTMKVVLRKRHLTAEEKALAVQYWSGQRKVVANDK